MIQIQVAHLDNVQKVSIHLPRYLIALPFLSRHYLSRQIYFKSDGTSLNELSPRLHQIRANRVCLQGFNLTQPSILHTFQPHDKHFTPVSHAAQEHPSDPGPLLTNLQPHAAAARFPRVPHAPSPR